LPVGKHTREVYGGWSLLWWILFIIIVGGLWVRCTS
jgi:hypothetical protein